MKQGITLFTDLILLLTFVVIFSHLEPVGSRAPSFSFESQILIMKRPMESTFALLCPAQAFPTPSFK